MQMNKAGWLITAATFTCIGALCFLVHVMSLRIIVMIAEIESLQVDVRTKTEIIKIYQQMIKEKNNEDTISDN